jgi:hypothetical protein
MHDIGCFFAISVHKVLKRLSRPTFPSTILSPQFRACFTLYEPALPEFYIRLASSNHGVVDFKYFRYNPSLAAAIIFYRYFHKYLDLPSLPDDKHSDFVLGPTGS